MTPVRDKRWGETDQSWTDSRSDLDLVTLAALGKTISVPKHLQAADSKEIPGEKRDEVTQVPR